MRRTTKLLTSVTSLVCLAAGAVIAAAAPAHAAPARANGQTNTVIFIHGFKATDCYNNWAPARTRFGNAGWTGAMVTYGYYSADTNCTREYPGTEETPLKTIGKDLANWIYTAYSSRGVKVDVVAHSMGGLLIRSALTEVAKGTTGYPAYLYVEDVVTLGTPHNGPRLNHWSRQGTDMKYDSTFLNGLAERPVSAMGTDWTNIGSHADEVVTPFSATEMNGQHKVLYEGSAGIDHGELIRVSSGTHNARVSHNAGSTWGAVNDYVSPVEFARLAVYYSSSL